MHGPRSFIDRTLWAALSLGATVPLLGQAAPLAAVPAPPIAYSLDLPGGLTAKVFSNGVAAVFSKDLRSVEFRAFPVTPQYDEVAGQTGLPDKARLIADLAAGAKASFAEARVIVVFASGVTGASDVVAGRAAAFTNDSSTNDTLAGLGVDRSERLFGNLDKSSLATMRAGAEADLGRPLLDFSNAYRLRLVTGASVRQAVNALRRSPAVVYASPDFRVASTQAISIPIPAGTAEAAGAAGAPQLLSSAGLPPNFALTASAQSLLNAPATDAAAAFDEIDRQFHELPGQGEIITNVSLGDLDDASAVNNSADPCDFYATNYGPTTVMIGGQRYLNWPSMPLIPTYTSNQSGQLSGSGEVCGVDPLLGEVGLDFSMMAPLPHALQRPGEVGSGLTDLLGIAPGASYRLVVPAPEGAFVTNSDVAAAFLGAGMQLPAPSVITASLGFAADQSGFSGRYLEDDPLTEAVIASLVSKNIVVTVSSGDGLRTFTNAAVAPSGGSAPTQVIGPDQTPSDLNDVAFSGAPSLDFDSGSIDVGGTTLNDINSAPPQDPANASLAAQHAFPETRWNGFTNFSSGYGSRVNVSAPSDNVLGFSHPFGGAADAVQVGLSGGTSASAPQTAAAAAVVMQVARLTGHPFGNARQVRGLLARTGTPVPTVPQSDVNNFVGPQINVRRAVERLLERADLSVGRAVPRVAVAQRRNYSLFDAAFLSATDPSNIDLLGPVSSADGTMTGRNAKAWITIAPDWEGLPDQAHFALTVGDMTIATTPWARLLPEQILGAAGLPLASSTSRTVDLTYQASMDGAVLAQAQFSLTFGPAASTARVLHAPLVPAVVDGATVPVTYDLTGVRNVSNPTLLVSEPGRINPASGFIYRAIYRVPLTTLTGTVQIPVTALQGGGIYGINILFGAINNSPLNSDFAYTRVSPAGSSRPPAPLLSQNGSNPGHFLEVAYGGSFQLSWDVSGTENADGATLEVSAPGPGTFNDENPFNNPNGTLRDQNGVDTGSVAFVVLPGVNGTVTLNAKTLGLLPTLNHVVRVLPTRSGGGEGGAHSTAAGEAGEVSTITMDGVLAADGGFANNGFAIDQHGNRGLLTSGQKTASGAILTSLETFDQSTNAIVKTVASQQNNKLYFTNGWGIWGGSVGLFGLSDQITFASSYNLLNPATGTIGPAWTPPSPNTLQISEGAANQANDRAVFLAYDATASGNTTAWRLLTSNIAENTFGPLIDLSPTVAAMGLPVFTAIGQNTSTNQAATPVGDFSNFCAAPTIVAADLGSGTLSSFSGVTSGFPYGIAVDSVTNKAVVPTICDNLAGIYDLGAKTGVVVHPQGTTNIYPAIDQTRGLIVMDQVAPADFGVNNNAMSSAVVMDERGNVLATLEHFFFFNTFLTIGANNLQLNPATRTGWTLGPGQQQLAPFGY
jgi:hypothetical protein